MIMETLIFLGLMQEVKYQSREGRLIEQKRIFLLNFQQNFS